MAVTTFNIDPKMDETLEELKEHFGARSKSEVLRKAVALLKVATEKERKDGSIVIRGEEEDVRVIVR